MSYPFAQCPSTISMLSEQGPYERKPKAKQIGTFSADILEGYVTGIKAMGFLLALNIISLCVPTKAKQMHS